MDTATIARTYRHIEDVYSMATSPRDPEVFVTSSSRAGETVLWKAPGAGEHIASNSEYGEAGEEEGEVGGGGSSSRARSPGDPGAPASLERVAALGPLRSPKGRDEQGQRGEKVKWQPKEEGGGSGACEVVGTACEATLRLWTLEGVDAKETTTLAMPKGEHIQALAFDPHHSFCVSAGHGTTVTGFDTRVAGGGSGGGGSSGGAAAPVAVGAGGVVPASKVAFQIGRCHSWGVRDVDYNPNKPLCLVTAGDDRVCCFWDLRNLSAPIRKLVGHRRAVATCRYNGFHDQLLLSGGCDHAVNLWRISSVSSAPLLDLSEEGIGAGGAELPMTPMSSIFSAAGARGSDGDSRDSCIRTFAEGHHEEAVYSLAWSASDAWVFASVDFLGNIAINNVPSTEKYKILL